MSYPMGSSAVVDIVDDAERTPVVRLPLSEVGQGGGDAAATVRSVLDDELLDAMVARMRGDGVRLSGPGGFLTEMLKAVLERGLQAELTEHLGYGRHDPAGHGSGTLAPRGNSNTAPWVTP